MTGDDCSDLAALWSAPAPAAEQREWERLARSTPRRARTVQAAELIFVFIIGACIVAAIVWRLGPGTVLTGSLILLLLGWSAWNRHRLTEIALLIDGSDRASFMASLVRAKEAELRRSAIGLALILPGTLLSAALSYLVQADAAQVSFARFLPDVLLTTRGMVAIAFLGSAMMLLTLAHLRLAGELARLRELRSDYADETRLDAMLGP